MSSDDPLTFGSLFTGVGGFDLGLERAGMRVLWQCESDAYCRRVLARHWPGVACHPDVRDLRGADVAPVDVLAAGWPCPGFSVAGRGGGFEHDGSGLWTEVVRLVRELRPGYVVLENVAALLARGFGRVLGDLATLGYDAEWDCIPASAVGAPHRRDRLWIVAYPGGEGRRQDARGAHGDEATDARRGEKDDHELGGPVADPEILAVGAGLRQSEPRGQRRRRPGDSSSTRNPWTAEPDVGRVAHGVPARMDRLRSLGNALVPQIAEWIGRRIVSYDREGRP